MTSWTHNKRQRLKWKNFNSLKSRHPGNNEIFPPAADWTWMGHLGSFVKPGYKQEAYFFKKSLKKYWATSSYYEPVHCWGREHWLSIPSSPAT